MLIIIMSNKSVVRKTKQYKADRKMLHVLSKSIKMKVRLMWRVGTFNLTQYRANKGILHQKRCETDSTLTIVISFNRKN